MALPTDFLPGYTSDGTSVTIPLTALPGLTATEADAATGDGRKVSFEIIKALQSGYAGLTPAPARMNATIATPTGVNATTVRRGYTFQFEVDIADADVAPEA